MLCLFAMASFTIISFFDSVLNLSPFRPVLYGVTQQSCTATSQRFANWCRGRNWKMLVKRKRTFLGQLGHQRTRTSCNEKHYRHCVRAIICISAKLPVLSWDLHFCELESVFHQEKKPTKLSFQGRGNFLCVQLICDITFASHPWTDSRHSSKVWEHLGAKSQISTPRLPPDPPAMSHRAKERNSSLLNRTGKHYSKLMLALYLTRELIREWWLRKERSNGKNTSSPPLWKYLTKIKWRRIIVSFLLIATTTYILKST